MYIPDNFVIPSQFDQTPGGGGGGAVDLTVTLHDINTDLGIGGHSTTTVPGGSVIFQNTISNSGGTASSSGQIGFYISNDSTITQSDRFSVYQVLLDTVPANGSTGGSYDTIELPSDLQPGTYYVGMIVDRNNTVAESNNNNNASIGLPVTITGAPVDDYQGVAARAEKFDVHTLATAVTINGRAGDDFIWAGQKNDTAFGGLGRDIVIGDNGNDTLYGDDGVSAALGSPDQVLGGRGNDTCYGGYGNDYPVLFMMARSGGWRM